MLRGGVRFTKGVGGMIGDNNDFALALNMTLPILVYVATQVQNRWVRLAAISLVPLTAITVVFTHSRGGFLSLAAVTVFMILRSRRKLLAMAVVAILVVAGSMFVPQSFYERMGTIGDFRNDSSSMGRLNAWQASLSMANDYPVFGVGLDNFLFMFVYYAPDPEDIHVAHNTYLQVLAEAGYTGLILYLGLFAVAGWTLWSAHRRARRYRIDWASQGATYLQASVLAFLVGGIFLNRAHFDLIYHVIILGCCLERIVTHDIAVMREEARTEARQVRAA
jgi:probable O-glycosylation ligase (exosortase A-associated)